MFYSNTFANNPWVCPNTTTIETSGEGTYFAIGAYNCSASLYRDESEGNMTIYAGDDSDCKDEGVIPEKLSSFTVATMMVSDTFNPYTYHETGTVQQTTRYDGGTYSITAIGNYVNEVSLSSETLTTSTFYTNLNKVMYNDGFLLGMNEHEDDFYDYQLG